MPLSVCLAICTRPKISPVFIGEATEYVITSNRKVAGLPTRRVYGFCESCSHTRWKDRLTVWDHTLLMQGFKKPVVHAWGEPYPQNIYGIHANHALYGEFRFDLATLLVKTTREKSVVPAYSETYWPNGSIWSPRSLWYCTKTVHRVPQLCVNLSVSLSSCHEVHLWHHISFNESAFAAAVVLSKDGDLNWRLY